MSGTEGRRQGGGRAPLPLALPLDTNSQGCPKRCRANLNVRVSLSRVRSFSLPPLRPRAGNEVERGHQFPCPPRLVLRRDARFRERCQPLSHRIPGKDGAAVLPVRSVCEPPDILSEVLRNGFSFKENIEARHRFSGRLIFEDESILGTINLLTK